MFIKQKIPTDDTIELTKKQENLQRELRDAAHKGDIETVRKALKKGANPLRKYCSAFGLACQDGHLEVVKLLQGLGCDVEMKNFHWTASKGHIEVVDFLLSVKPDKKQEFIDDALSYTAEPYITHHKQIKMAKHLLALGADVNADNGAALYQTAQYNIYEMALLFLENGAEIKERHIKAAKEEEERRKGHDYKTENISKLLENWPQIQKAKATKAKRNALHKRIISKSITPKM